MEGETRGKAMYCINYEVINKWGVALSLVFVVMVWPCVVVLSFGSGKIVWLIPMLSILLAMLIVPLLVRLLVIPSIQLAIYIVGFSCMAPIIPAGSILLAVNAYSLITDTQYFVGDRFIVPSWDGMMIIHMIYILIIGVIVMAIAGMVKLLKSSKKQYGAV